MKTSTELNLVSLKILEWEIGNHGVASLGEFGAWLSLPSDHSRWTGWEKAFKAKELPRSAKELRRWYKLPPRLAPSIICRSEVEVFSTSMPRFSLRLSLKG